MALILTMQCGDRVRIGETIFELDQIASSGDLFLKHEDEMFHIVEERYTEIMPDVLVSVGLQKEDWRAKVLIEAPRSIPIERIQ